MLTTLTVGSNEKNNLSQKVFCSLQSAVCGLQSAVCSLQSAVCSLRFHPTARKYWVFAFGISEYNLGSIFTTWSWYWNKKWPKKHSLHSKHFRVNIGCTRPNFYAVKKKAKNASNLRKTQRKRLLRMPKKPKNHDAWEDNRMVRVRCIRGSVSGRKS